MRLKSINKANSNTSNGLNSTRNPTNSDPSNSRNTYGNLSFNILNQDLSNIDENSFDLDMDSGEVLFTFNSIFFVYYFCCLFYAN